MIDKWADKETYKLRPSSEVSKEVNALGEEVWGDIARKEEMRGVLVKCESASAPTPRSFSLSLPLPPVSHLALFSYLVGNDKRTNDQTDPSPRGYNAPTRSRTIPQRRSNCWIEEISQIRLCEIPQMACGAEVSRSRSLSAKREVRGVAMARSRAQAHAVGREWRLAEV